MFSPQDAALDAASLDQLLAWLAVLGQDRQVLACSLQLLVSSAIGHALQLYGAWDGVSRETRH